MIVVLNLIYFVLGVSSISVQEAQNPVIRRTRNAIKGEIYRWNASAIPYQIDASIPNYNKQKILQTLSYIEQNTCLRFTENAGSQHFIRYIDNPDECASFVGRQNNLTHQNVNLTMSCQEQFDQILHETIHALGFYHEQSRSDRDLYVEVNEDILNKTNVAVGNWAKMDTDNQGLPYDYASIMHYYPSEGTHSRVPVLTARNNLSMMIRGMGLPTFQDVLEINKLYSCSDPCGIQQAISCQNGGYPDPNNCEMCKCPPSFGGPNCSQFESISLENSNPITMKCGGEIVQATDEWTMLKGSFHITNSASPLFVPTSCWWHIKAPEGKQVALRVLTMEKWGSTDCYDWNRMELNMEIKTESYWRTGYRFECYDYVQKEIFQSHDNLIAVGLYSNGYHNSFDVSFKISNSTSTSTISSDREYSNKVNLHKTLQLMI